MPGSDLTTVAQRRKAEPPRLIRAIAGDLDWIVMKALEKDRKRRYETANGLALDVQRYLADEAISARPPSALYKFQKAVLRNKLLFGAIMVIAILLMASLAVVTASLSEEKYARRKAETEETRSRQVTQFLKNMLEGVGPSVARGRDTAMLREILDRTSERIGHEIGAQPAVEAELRSLIGGLYFEIGNYDGAEKMQRRALAIYRKLEGPQSAQAGRALNDLGLALFKSGKPAEAERAHGEALAIRRRLFGNEHSEVAIAINNLAVVYRYQHRFGEAEALIREALQIRRKLFGNEHLEVADSLHNLAYILNDQGQRAEAESTARELLAMRRRLLGNDDPLVASALTDVAWVTAWTGKFAEAESLNKEALAMRRKVLGDEHPDVAKTIAELGEIISQQGKLDEGHAVLSAAISIQRKMLGEDNPDTLDSLDFLGWILEVKGKWTEAETVHRRTLTLWRRQAGNEYPQALSELAGLVRALVAQKKFAEAERLLNETLTPAFIGRPASAGVLAQRADLLGRKGRWREAATDAALASKHQTAEHYHYHRLAALLGITQNRPAYQQLCHTILPMFANTTNPYIAERVAQDCLLLPHSGADLQLVDQLAEKAVILGAADPSLPFFQAARAMSNLRLGRFSDAVAWAEKILKSPQAHTYAQAKAYAVLAMAYGRLGQADEAQAMLLKGNMLAPGFSSRNEGDELGDAWVARLFARISLDEAAALVQKDE